MRADVATTISSRSAFDRPVVRIHQRGVEGEEGPELVRPAGEGEEHVRNEAGLLLDGEDLLADVVGQVVEGGHVEPRDRRVAHRVSIAHVIARDTTANATAAAAATLSESTSASDRDPHAPCGAAAASAVATARDPRRRARSPAGPARSSDQMSVAVGRRCHRPRLEPGVGERRRTRRPATRAAATRHQRRIRISPMLTRTVRRVYGSRQVGSSTSPSKPKARAERATAPRFSGSLSPSSTTSRRVVRRELGERRRRCRVAGGDRAAVEVEARRSRAAGVRSTTYIGAVDARQQIRHALVLELVEQARSGRGGRRRSCARSPPDLRRRTARHPRSAAGDGVLELAIVGEPGIVGVVDPLGHAAQSRRAR